MQTAEITESFWMAMGALAAHKLRSALTLLGVMVGVFSIIMVMTAMRALQRIVESELSQLGAHTFQVQRWPGIYVGGPEGWEKYWRRSPLYFSQFHQLQTRATLARNVGAEASFGAAEVITRYEQTNPNVELKGVTPETFAAKNWVVAEGRGLLPADLDRARPVCVLGHALAQKVFPRGSAVNQTVKHHGVNFVVVGVLAARGGMVGGDQDNFLAIPLTTGLNQYSRERSLSFLVQAWNQATYDDTVEQVRGILRTLRKVPPGKEDDFEILSNDSLIKQFQSLTFAFRIGVMLVSSVALVAAGIGIMNIMLVSVTERTREIGVRRAIGAKQRNILTQFILEAVVICQIGGVLGVLVGLVGGNLVAFYLKVPAVVPVDWVLIGLGICMVVGVVFGTYPAVKAAHLDPIESLRYE